MELEAIKPTRLTGAEPIKTSDGQAVSSLLSFWQWAYSDLIGNTERGALAEYIVATALGINQNTRINWDSYDLRSPEGLKIEGKASGYIQTWKQERLSSISFGIQKTHRWDAQFNLGLMYAEGQGVDQSDEEAVKWFRMAAEQGNADAQYSLGRM